MLGLTPADCLVMGDGENDLEMLRNVASAGGVAVAVGNAVPSLKAVASYVSLKVLSLSRACACSDPPSAHPSLPPSLPPHSLALSLPPPPLPTPLLSLPFLLCISLQQLTRMHVCARVCACVCGYRTMIEEQRQRRYGALLSDNDR
jgi:hypothetical protein